MLAQAPPDTTVTRIPAQRRDPNAAQPGQVKYAKQLMRRLWACDPEVSAELCAALEQMGRAQLGRIIDNLLWTLADQPRPMNAAQWQRIQLLWPRKMRKPMDDAIRQRFAQMTEYDADRAVRQMHLLPDLVAV